MPAATCQAPGSPASSTQTSSPRWAARQAAARPIGPAPTTATSGLRCSTATCTPSLRRHHPDQVRRSAARCRPLSPICGLPYAAHASARGVLDWELMTPRERIASARLYLVCDARPRAFVEAALRGGVDIVQLRDKALDDDTLIAAAREFRAAAD